ncbi:hydroxymethylpyrimidine/phosphomethylpyrimidine kinase [Marinoscillum furvescens]|uniref:hydroxymethylpyrimidine kinase n=1 Tax=Marinoscillum furvescens DSM 4134 TaxID=1122208 RepID=A0A3D9L6H5_MARFU|nr:hydroxymethylpyrimidine/phosphomethylpyrimidine kinase [Marinoscillum furvescens]REE01780.1 hydroxymethylpyrimidine/phosphomethylpyrimidine kinase [Marinoscillum furvescens DSM 4134]
MSENVLCIGGMDPSGGAGLLADIKTLHQFGVNGFGVTTAITYQNESAFEGLEWVAPEQLIRQLAPLLGKGHSISAIKIGLIQDLEVLDALLKYLQQQLPNTPVIWDPVLSASAGWTFHNELDGEVLRSALSRVGVLTPNLPESRQLATVLGLEQLTLLHGPHLLLKGGHHEGEPVDRLYHNGTLIHELSGERLEGKSLHGSGCVFASALAAGIAKGKNLITAFAHAKNYVYELIKASETPLGKHHLVS